MGAPHLTVVNSDDPAICGARTVRGGPCRNPAGEDGRCWLSSHKDRGAAERDLPEPPEHLNEVGRKYWYYHVKRCRRAGVIEIVDMTVVEKAAEVAQILRQCMVEVSEDGLSLESQRSKKPHPSFSKYNALIGDYRQICKQIDGWVAQGEMTEDEEGSGDGWSDW